MKFANLTIHALASGVVVLDTQGQMRRLEPGEQPGPGDLIVDLGEGAAGETDISAQLVDDQLQATDIALDDVIGQIVQQIEQGVDPTQQGDEFATAAGGQNGSSPTGSGDIERTGAETQASTEFDTSGLESQGLSETQSLALTEIIAQALISGVTIVNEDETDVAIVTGGTLTTDDETVTFVPIVDVPGDNGFGTFSIDEDGNWTFTANDPFDELAVGDTNTDTITVITTDDTEQVLTVNINGTNDDAVVSVDDIALVEDDAPLATAGTLTATDVDNPDNTFIAVNTVGAIGTFDMDEDGNWTFLANSAFDELNVGDSVTETYNVTSIDGTPSTVKITINGTNDAATVSSADVAMDETNAPLATGGTLTSSDVDNDDNKFVAVNTVGAIGTFDMDEDGNWTFLANSAFDYLNVNESVTETYYLTSIDGTPSFVKITINGTNDGPVAESFAVDAEDNLIVPIVFDSDVPADDHISDPEDDHDGLPLNIKITSLPDSGTLLFTDSDGVTREITQTDVDSETLFDQDSISFVPGAGPAFELGYSGDPEDMPDLVDGFYNWGEEVSPTERQITLDNGNTIGISITDNNNKPLKQYEGEQPHVGYGIGDTDGRGMNKQETLIIDLSDNPLDVVTFGLDGMGGSFNTNSDVYVEVTYTLADGTTHTEQYQKDEGHTGNSQIMYDFSFASPNNPIVQMEMSSSGGSWELRYLAGNQEVTDDVTFDYLVVDSNGAESSTETVSIDVSDAEQYDVHAAENGEQLVAQLGNDLLIGNDDSNLFTWLDSTLDSGTDVIKDFEVHNGVSGDLIDLNDLLDDPSDSDEVDTLLASIGVDVDGDDVTLTIPIDGNANDQTIIVEDVVQDLSNPLDDLAILSDLIKNDAA